MIKLLHFSDAHIDIASQGKRDPDTGLSIRVMDFLRALDKIIDTAIEENVDLVIFAGDAYKDRTPVPTFQREWGKRIVRLSNHGIPTILLVGNHDLSPAVGRASALQEFDTLSIPNIHLVSKPELITPEQIGDVPLQIIALPWITRSGYLSTQQDKMDEIKDLDQTIETITTRIVENFIQKINPDLPTIFTAHASVQSAVYGGERSIMLGNDIILPLGLVRNPDFDYVALGHIHKAQNLNEDFHPPAIYPGSIEKVDFGEAGDDKYFVIAEIEKGETKVNWHKLDGRIVLDLALDLKTLSQEDGFIPTPGDIKSYMQNELPDQQEVENALVRLSITYPQGWENLIDDRWINERFDSSLEFHLVRKPVFNTRLRLGEDETITNLPPESLLERYWESNNLSIEEIDLLKSLAMEIIYNRSEE